MQIVGPLPVGSVGQTTQTLELKPFQRVTAEVMQVNGTTAVLTIDGVEVVAEVPSSDVAAALKGRTSAQFIISQLEDGRTALRLVNQGPALPPQAGPTPEPPQDLPMQLLREYGLPVTTATQTAAEAVINQRLALQPGQMDQLLRVLASQPGWGAQEANLAAAILAAGLPLTPESLALAGRPEGLSAENLAALTGLLQTAQQDAELAPDLRAQAGAVLQNLQEAVLQPGSPAALPGQLERAIDLLGRPLENLLAEEATGPGTPLAQAAPAQSGLSPGAELAGQLARMQSSLQGAQLPAAYKDLLAGMIQVLQNGLAPGGTGAELAQAAQALGQPVEALLASQAGKGGAIRLAGDGSQAVPLELIRLQASLEQSGLPAAAKSVLRAAIQSLMDASANPASGAGLGAKLAQRLEAVAPPLDGLLAELGQPGGLSGNSAPGGQELTRAGIQDVVRQIGQMQGALRDANLSPDVKAVLRTVYQALQEAVQGFGQGGSLAEQLASALDSMGQSLDNLLAERARISSGAESLRLNGRAAALPGADRAGIAAVRQMLIAMQEGGLPSEVKDALQTVYRTLLQSLAEPGGTADLNARLTRALNLFSQVQEARLAEDAHPESSRAASSGQAAMAHLQQEAARAGKHELSRVLDDFMQSLSKAQWQNAPSNAQNQHEDWVEAALWMRLPGAEQGSENIPLRLRVDRQPGESAGKIDASVAHIVVQVELPGQPGRAFQVEIGMNQRQVKADVSVPEPQLYEPAREELPGLAESLQDQGYTLSESQVEIGSPPRFEKVHVLPVRDSVRTGINKEI